MLFEQLFIKNFLSIQEANLSLEGKGLVLIQGENRDDPSAKSNGAGKSAIPDALCWALTGKTARGIVGDDVVNKIAGKDCLVEVHITSSAEDAKFVIKRFRKHRTEKNALSVTLFDIKKGGMTSLTKGTEKETQKVIEDIIGCSPEVFMAAIYAGQENTVDLPAMTDRVLKSLIEEAAGISRIEKAYVLAREKALAINREKDRIESALDIRKAVERKSSENCEELKKAFVNHKMTMLADVEKMRSELSDDFVELDKLEVTAKEAEKKNTLLSEEAKTLNETLLAYRKILDEASALKLTASMAAREVETQSKVVGLLKAEQDEALGNIENHEHVIGTNCNECGRPFTKKDAEKYKQAQVKIANDLKEQLEAAEKLQQTLQQTYEKAQKSSVEFAVPDVNEITNRIRDIGRERTENISIISRYDLALKNFEEKKQKIRSFEDGTAPNPFKGALVKAVKDLQEAGDAVRTEEEKLKFASEKSMSAENVVKVFGPAGVRAHILDTVTPFLNERTAEYLTALSDGNITAIWSTLTRTAAGELREKFNISVSNTKGAKSFAGLSGGEKRKVRLATMLALQDLVASRATKPIYLWIGDEIDDALDSFGLERLMVLLESKAREKGTVLVISHNELTDWVDQTTTVIKEGGFAKVEGDLVKV